MSGGELTIKRLKQIKWTFKMIDKEVIWYKGKQYILKESILQFIKERSNMKEDRTAFDSGYQYALFSIERLLK